MVPLMEVGGEGVRVGDPDESRKGEDGSRALSDEKAEEGFVEAFTRFRGRGVGR